MIPEKSAKSQEPGATSQERRETVCLVDMKNFQYRTQKREKRTENREQRIKNREKVMGCYPLVDLIEPTENSKTIYYSQFTNN